MRIATLLLFALPLAACDGPGTNIHIDATGEDGNATISGDGNGSLSIKVPGFEGSVKLPKIKIDAADFDVNGLKLYPGSTIRDLGVNAEEKMGQRDKGRVSVAFDSPASIATVRTWFGEQLSKQGFKVSPKGEGFAGTTDEGDAFVLELTTDGDQKTTGKLQAGN